MRRPVACSSLRARLCSKLCHWSSGWRSSRAHVPACSRPTYLLAVRAATRGGVRSALLLTRGHMDITSVIADKGIFESVSGAAKPSQYQQISGTRRPLWCPGCRDAVAPTAISGRRHGCEVRACSSLREAAASRGVRKVVIQAHFRT